MTAPLSAKDQKPVRWIKPEVRRGVAHWPACQCELSSDDAIAARKRIGVDVLCANRAKINFHGKLVCIRHAGRLALDELLGMYP